MKICGSCGGAGHNARTCGRHEADATIDAIMLEPPPVHGPDLAWRPVATRAHMKRAGRECFRCVRPTARVGLCAWHYWRHRRRQRAYLKRRRAKAKLDGTCLNCYQRQAAPDSSYCEPCDSAVRNNGAAWSRSRKGKASKRDSQRRIRAERADLGLCIRCPEPSVHGAIYCEAHRDEHNARSAKRRARLRGGRPSRPVTCKRCKGVGHYAKTCKAEDEKDAISLTEYATARMGKTIEPNWEVYQ